MSLKAVKTFGQSLCAALTLALILVGAAPASSQAQTASEGIKEFLERVYQPYIGEDAQGDSFSTPDKSPLLFDAAIVKLLAKDQKEAEEKDTMGRIDFNPFVNGQEFSIKTVGIKVTADDGSQAKAVATFNNGGRKQAVNYDLTKTAKGWRISNISWPKTSYTLRSILEGPLP